MMNIADVLEISPYSLARKDKEKIITYFLNQLSMHHYKYCPSCTKMMDGIGYNHNKEYVYTQLPFIPVRLFKIFDLKSTKSEAIIKTMTSSGTSGQEVSRIYLDRETATNQTKVLTKIISSFLGKQRLPMIIIDSEAVVKKRNLFSARAAGIFGFSMFGTKRIFALDEDMELNAERINDFLQEHKGERILLFGFTFMIWQHFYKRLIEKSIRLDLSNSILIHGGGWKKLLKESVPPREFKKELENICGINHVHDYYGMVEQTGSIYMECEYNHLHASIFSDIIIRRASDFSIADKGEAGIVQLVSILPNSYPGHSLLTEDEGTLFGEDDCPCGRLGKYFKVNGRLQNAEIRGCSDTYAEQF